MEELIERVGAEDERLSTSARISPATAAALEKQRLRLGVLAGRELTNNDVIRVMHRTFVQLPETVIAQAVQE